MTPLRSALLLATSFSALFTHGASAQAVIDNGAVQLGINPAGNLVTGGIGLTFLNTTAASGEALAPGCACEGWGVADLTTGEFAKAGQSFGFSNIVSSGLTVTGTGTDASSSGNAATSVTGIADGALSLQLTHDFAPSASSSLYEVDVIIENTGAGGVGDLVYRRAMDWDVPDTEFSEFVTIGGWPAANLIGSSDDGFADGNPNVALTTIAPDAVLNGNFTDSGPADHGSVFDFGFGTLAAGDTTEFQMFYGAAASEADAFVALGEVGAEVFSLGQPSSTDGDTLGTPHTFIFGFAGVGGTPIGPGGGGAATTPLNFAGQFANLVVDHHLYRSAQRLDRLSLSRASATVSTKGDDITPLGLSGITIRLTGSYFDGEFDATTNNVGLDYDTNYLAVSVEREFSVSGGTFSRGMVGFSFGYEDVDASRKDGLGSFDLDGMSYSIYGGVADPNGAFVDGALFYSDLDYEQQRIGLTNVFSSSPEGDSKGGRLRGGYNIDLGDAAGPGSGPQVNQTFGVYAEWTYRDTSIDSYTENNGGLTTTDFSDKTNEVGVGVRYGFDGFGASRNVFGNVDVALLSDLSGDDYNVAQTTLGGTALTSVVDGNDGVTLRSSVEVGFTEVSGWSGAARLGSRLNEDHSEVEVGLDITRRF
ncbi:Autotransporter beta-domain protein [Roseovarius tolerans]|uniref:Autotransporter beta-domain protein n=1 Tax=Roseovarius tolerans TaxID=74031 RepID=A0A0L6CQK5_9RHOB|nr:autotransporter outer membrane beta-barrel domain-containing protein [Roseovarius tolerans]KNX39833.1 Autotransporter beta-domain protein [Roseovarius tolerans]